MSEADLRAAAERFGKIKALKQYLKDATDELGWVNQHVKIGGVYKVSVSLKKEQHYNEKTQTYIELDAAVVQQHCVNRVSDLRRQIIKLGGEP